MTSTNKTFNGNKALLLQRRISTTAAASLTSTTKSSAALKPPQQKQKQKLQQQQHRRSQRALRSATSRVFTVKRVLACLPLLIVIIAFGRGCAAAPAAANELGALCQHDMDCTDFIKGSTCSASGRCECAPYFVQLNASTCLSSQLLGGDCMLDDQCTMKVANSSCLDGACRCVEGFLQFRKHTCLGPAHPGAVCYSHAHCQMFDGRTHCDFLIPNLFGRCQCTAPARMVGGICVNENVEMEAVAEKAEVISSTTTSTTTPSTTTPTTTSTTTTTQQPTTRATSTTTSTTTTTTSTSTSTSTTTTTPPPALLEDELGVSIEEQSLEDEELEAVKLTPEVQTEIETSQPVEDEHRKDVIDAAQTEVQQPIVVSQNELAKPGLEPEPEPQPEREHEQTVTAGVQQLITPAEAAVTETMFAEHETESVPADDYPYKIDDEYTEEHAATDAPAMVQEEEQVGHNSVEQVIEEQHEAEAEAEAEESQHVVDNTMKFDYETAQDELDENVEHEPEQQNALVDEPLVEEEKLQPTVPEAELVTSTSTSTAEPTVSFTEASEPTTVLDHDQTVDEVEETAQGVEQVAAVEVSEPVPEPEPELEPVEAATEEVAEIESVTNAQPQTTDKIDEDQVEAQHNAAEEGVEEVEQENLTQPAAEATEAQPVAEEEEEVPQEPAVEEELHQPATEEFEAQQPVVAAESNTVADVINEEETDVKKLAAATDEILDKPQTQTEENQQEEQFVEQTTVEAERPTEINEDTEEKEENVYDEIKTTESNQEQQPPQEQQQQHQLEDHVQMVEEAVTETDIATQVGEESMPAPALVPAPAPVQTEVNEAEQSADVRPTSDEVDLNEVNQLDQEQVTEPNDELPIEEHQTIEEAQLAEQHGVEKVTEHEQLAEEQEKENESLRLEEDALTEGDHQQIVEEQVKEEPQSQVVDEQEKGDEQQSHEEEKDNEEEQPPLEQEQHKEEEEEEQQQQQHGEIAETPTEPTFENENQTEAGIDLDAVAQPELTGQTNDDELAPEQQTTLDVAAAHEEESEEHTPKPVSDDQQPAEENANAIKAPEVSQSMPALEAIETPQPEEAQDEHHETEEPVHELEQPEEQTEANDVESVPITNDVLANVEATTAANDDELQYVEGTASNENDAVGVAAPITQHADLADDEGQQLTDQTTVHNEAMESSELNEDNTMEVVPEPVVPEASETNTEQNVFSESSKEVDTEPIPAAEAALALATTEIINADDADEESQRNENENIIEGAEPSPIDSMPQAPIEADEATLQAENQEAADPIDHLEEASGQSETPVEEVQPAAEEYVTVAEEATTQAAERDYTLVESLEHLPDGPTQQIESESDEIRTQQENQEPEVVHTMFVPEPVPIKPEHVEEEDDHASGSGDFKESESIADILSDLMAEEESTLRPEIVEETMADEQPIVEQQQLFADLLAEPTHIEESNAESPNEALAEKEIEPVEQQQESETATETVIDADDKLITFYPEMNAGDEKLQQQPQLNNDEMNNRLAEHAAATDNAPEAEQETDVVPMPEELPLNAPDEAIRIHELESDSLVVETTTEDNQLAPEVEPIDAAQLHHEEATDSPNDIIDITTQTMLGLASRVTLMEPAAPVVTTLKPLMAPDDATPEPSNEIYAPTLILTTKPTSEIRKRVDLGLEAVSLGLACANDKQCQLADPHTVCNARGVCDCSASGAAASEQQQCGAERTGCSPGTFQCRSSGVCISWFFVCDGRPDCNDDSDEECTFNARLNQTCPAEAFHCERSGRCVSRSALCDGRKQCPHGEDELGCTALKSGECPPHTFRCNSGECLPEYEYCNAIISCKDGSDEPPHLCGSRSMPNLFMRLLDAGGLLSSGRDPAAYCPHRCSNGRCRSTAIVCSGRDGCGDGTDEQTCAVCRCPAPTANNLPEFLARHRPMPLW